MSEQERDKAALQVKGMVKNAVPMNGRTIYYVEVRRNYPKPAEFQDRGCDAITWYTAWLLKEKDRISVHNARAVLTDCDMKSAYTAAPAVLISVGNEDYVVSIKHGWESERYTVDRVTANGLWNVVTRSGGGC